MRTSPTNSLLDHLRRAMLPPDGAGLGDGELLGRFIERHDEMAFAVLVNRHGPMVWGVCRRLLHQHDAEDAFQATFLVLARKAASIRSKEMVGNWLYGVAHQTALHARRTAARRRTREVQVTTMPDFEAVGPDPWADIQPLLDEELSRLPDIYREVIVLCDLEGRTRKEVAGHLGVPEGTVAARVARARARLAKRLAQRGVALSGGVLAAVLAQQAASAGVPKSVVVSTIKAASLLAAAKAAATGAISVKVAALTKGVMKAMLFNKLKLMMAVFLASVFIGGVGVAYVYSLRAARAAQHAGAVTGDKPADKKPATDKERLQGTWQVVELAVQGKELQKVPEDDGKRLRAVFKGDQLEWRGNKLTYTIDPSKKPKHMDWNAGDEEKVLAIYELEGDTLKVCITNPGENRPTEFKSVDGPLATGGKEKVFVLKRVKEKADK
jgi:RNA polymerase sigma factor (sigma-70 family)